MNTINSVKLLRANNPAQFNDLIQHLEGLENTANDALVSSISEEIMRQNQGKVQVLRELITLLKS